jgi:hypothetical protein
MGKLGSRSRDITDRKKEEPWKIGCHRSIPMTLLLVKPEGIVISWNNTAEKFWLQRKRSANLSPKISPGTDQRRV